jgi:hypothetical protein
VDNSIWANTADSACVIESRNVETPVWTCAECGNPTKISSGGLPAISVRAADVIHSCAGEGCDNAIRGYSADFVIALGYIKAIVGTDSNSCGIRKLRG